jgi:hypothetical protein
MKTKLTLLFLAASLSLFAAPAPVLSPTVSTAEVIDQLTRESAKWALLAFQFKDFPVASATFQARADEALDMIVFIKALASMPSAPTSPQAVTPIAQSRGQRK